MSATPGASSGALPDSIDLRYSQGAVIGAGSVTQAFGYTYEQVVALVERIRRADQPRAWNGRQPYPGLAAFDEADADLFFGRDALAGAIIERIRQSRFVAVVGPSGSGKSSLVQARVIPKLKQGAINGSDRWLFARLTPRDQPIEQLAQAMSAIALQAGLPAAAGNDIRARGLTDPAALRDLAGVLARGAREQRVALFVDQFEELFAPALDEAQRAAFLGLVAQAVGQAGGRVTLIAAVRSDFLSQCIAYPQLRALMDGEGTRLVGAMEPEELASAIIMPALEVGVQVEPALVSQVIAEMKGEPGALPLMQFAMRSLMDSEGARKGAVAQLTLADYLASGGVGQALERHADAVLRQLTPAQVELARGVFARLVGIGRGAAATRRTALLSALAWPGAAPDQVQAVVQALADARLVTTGDQAEAGARTVTISHEKLIEAWPWLRTLVNENRAAIERAAQVEADAARWREGGRDASYLYAGARLAAAREQQESGARQPVLLSTLGLEFLGASIEAQQAQARRLEEARQRELRSARRRALTFGVLFLAALVAAIVAGLLFNQSQAQQRVITARQLAAQSTALSEDRLDLALLLARAAYQIDPGFESKRSLLNALQASPQLAMFLPGHTAAARAVAFHPAGGTAVSAGDAGELIAWDVRTGQPIARAGGLAGASIRSLAYGPDGAWLAAAGSDGVITLRDSQTLEAAASLGVPGAQLAAIAVSPDGALIAGAGCEAQSIQGGRCARGAVWLWRTADRALRGPPLHGHAGMARDVAFSPDGSRLATGGDDGSVWIWDVEDGAPVGVPLAAHVEPVLSVAFSPYAEETRLVSGGNDGRVTLWDYASGAALAQADVGDRSPVYAVLFDHQAASIFAAGSGRVVAVWDIVEYASGPALQLRTVLAGHPAAVTGLALNADDRALLSAGEDGAVLLWDLTRDQQLGQPLGPAQGRVWTLDLSPDGRLLAYARCDDLVNLEDDGCIRGRVGVVDLSEPDGGVAGEARAGPEIEAGVGGRTALRWSPDGGTLAVGGCARYDLGARRCAEGEVRLYAAGPGGRLSLSQALDGYADWVTSVDFSPDGRTLAAGSRLGAIDFRDPASGAMVGSPIAAHDGAVWQVAYDRQGALLASAGGDGRVGVWDARTGQAAVPALEGHAGAVWSVAFSPDGALLASGGADNAVRLWEAKTGQPAGRPLTGHARAINGLAFSPDGAALVSASGDATLMWWDVAARDRLGQAFRGPGNGVTQVEFTPDGLQFVSSSLDGRLVAWDASLASWLARACRVAHRGLTPAESAQYLGGAGEGGACGGIGD